jgi:hypothetical protein
MLVGGIDIVARGGGAGSTASESAETWRRVGVLPRIELHLRDGLPELKPAELKSLLERVETALRRRFH